MIWEIFHIKLEVWLTPPAHGTSTGFLDSQVHELQNKIIGTIQASTVLVPPGSAKPPLPRHLLGEVAGQKVVETDLTNIHATPGHLISIV